MAIEKILSGNLPLRPRSMPAFTKWPLHLVGRCWECAVEDVHTGCMQVDDGRCLDLRQSTQVHIISFNIFELFEDC